MTERMTDDLLTIPVLSQPPERDSRSVVGAIVTSAAILLLAASEVFLPKNGDLGIRKNYAARVGATVQQIHLDPAVYASGTNYLVVNGYEESAPIPMDKGNADKARHDLMRAVDECLGRTQVLPALTLRHVDREGVQEVVLGEPRPVTERGYQSAVRWAAGAWKKASSITVADTWRAAGDSLVAVADYFGIGPHKAEEATPTRYPASNVARKNLSSPQDLLATHP